MSTTVVNLPVDINSFLDFLSIGKDQKEQIREFANKIEDNGYFLQYSPDYKNEGWGCIPQLDHSIIQYHRTNHNVNFIAHEFYHASYFKNGFVKPDELEKDILGKTKFAAFVFPKFAANFINNLHHNKFITDYLADGYKKRDFVANYNEKLVKWKPFFTDLKAMSRTETGTLLFVTKFIELKCFWNPKFKCDYWLKRIFLFYKNKPLYKLLQRLFDDIKGEDCVKSKALITTFFLELENFIQ